jgi:hypothetical protein
VQPAAAAVQQQGAAGASASTWGRQQQERRQQQHLQQQQQQEHRSLDLFGASRAHKLQQYRHQQLQATDTDSDIACEADESDSDSTAAHIDPQTNLAGAFDGADFTQQWQQLQQVHSLLAGLQPGLHSGLQAAPVLAGSGAQVLQEQAGLKFDQIPESAPEPQVMQGLTRLQLQRVLEQQHQQQQDVSVPGQPQLDPELLQILQEVRQQQQPGDNSSSLPDFVGSPDQFQAFLQQEVLGLGSPAAAGDMSAAAGFQQEPNSSLPEAAATAATAAAGGDQVGAANLQQGAVRPLHRAHDAAVAAAAAPVAPAAAAAAAANDDDDGALSQGSTSDSEQPSSDIGDSAQTATAAAAAAAVFAGMQQDLVWPPSLEGSSSSDGSDSCSRDSGCERGHTAAAAAVGWLGAQSSLPDGLRAASAAAAAGGCTTAAAAPGRRSWGLPPAPAAAAATEAGSDSGSDGGDSVTGSDSDWLDGSPVPHTAAAADDDDHNDDAANGTATEFSTEEGEVVEGTESEGAADAQNEFESVFEDECEGDSELAESAAGDAAESAPGDAAESAPGDAESASDEDSDDEAYGGCGTTSQFKTAMRYLARISQEWGSRQDPPPQQQHQQQGRDPRLRQQQQQAKIASFVGVFRPSDQRRYFQTFRTVHQGLAWVELLTVGVSLEDACDDIHK